MKQKGFLHSSRPDEAELEKINKYTKRALTADEVYAFSVVLCDNEIDRDFERFTPDALKKLEKLFIGKSGIFDHSMKGSDQIARTYDCETEFTDELTSDGQQYVRLVAKAYVPRTSKTEDFILNLDAGINKEVSVGCAVGREVCSVCGADLRKGFCGHRKGEFYGDGADKKQCFVLLEEPTDAYEWSFVAVPAQRKAGVVKAFNYDRGDSSLNTRELIKSFGTGTVTLSENDALRIKKEFEKLEQLGNEYTDHLKKAAVRCCADSLPTLGGEQLGDILDALSPTQLKNFVAALRQKQPLEMQLQKSETSEIAKNSEFVI